MTKIDFKASSHAPRKNKLHLLRSIKNCSSKTKYINESESYCKINIQKMRLYLKLFECSFTICSS